MIKVEIIESKDLETLGTKIFFKNQVYVGNNSNDIHISEDVEANCLSLEVNETGINSFISSDIHFLHNGKRAESGRKLNFGDTIQIANTTLKIIDAEYQVYKTKVQILEERFSEIEEKNPSLANIITIIQEQSEKIEM